MELEKQPLFAAIAQRMSWLGQRQRVLAQNVSNVDTPGYQARDLKPVDFRTTLGARLALASTEGGVSLGPARGGSMREQAQKSGEMTLSGNTVSLEDEMLKVSETGREYQLASNLYKKHLGMLRTAIGRTGS